MGNKRDEILGNYQGILDYYYILLPALPLIRPRQFEEPQLQLKGSMVSSKKLP